MAGAITPSEIARLTAIDALAHFKAGTLSPLEVVTDTLDRIAEENPRVNAFTHVDRDGALAAARASEARWHAGTPCGPLDGVPVTIKDLTLVAGMPTGFGSRTAIDQPPGTVDAPTVRFLREAGAVLIGKSATSEFGWKAVTDTPAHGITRNSWDLSRTPGGSSGGAGVAAHLNLGMLHLGSDAGGSIRIPASFTGTFGFKPTFGIAPQWPASLMGGLSHLGPMTRTVDDAILMLGVIARPDARDGYLANPDGAPIRRPGADAPKGLRIAYSPDLGYVRVDPAIAARVRAAVEILSRMGADVEEVSPGFENPIQTFETLFSGGIGQLADRFDPDRLAVFEDGLRARVEQGRRISLPAYLAAERARVELVVHMQTFHARYDLLVTPALPIAPFEVGSLVPPASGMSNWYDWAPFSYPFNLTQQPAASLPCGPDATGLPVGIQIVGPRFADARVLRLAKALEKRLAEHAL